MSKYYLAIDIGASSGRHLVGYKQDDEIVCQEVYRFPNGVKHMGGSLVWDIQSLLHHVKVGIKNALARYGKIESMAIDTWGVDYV
ncbi:MAG: rhamnulokinase, partial [Christensenellales bacterium]